MDTAVGSDSSEALGALGNPEVGLVLFASVLVDTLALLLGVESAALGVLLLVAVETLVGEPSGARHDTLGGAESVESSGALVGEGGGGDLFAVALAEFLLASGGGGSEVELEGLDLLLNISGEVLVEDESGEGVVEALQVEGAAFISGTDGGDEFLNSLGVIEFLNAFVANQLLSLGAVDLLALASNDLEPGLAGDFLAGTLVVQSESAVAEGLLDTLASLQSLSDTAVGDLLLGSTGDLLAGSGLDGEAAVALEALVTLLGLAVEGGYGLSVLGILGAGA